MSKKKIGVVSLGCDKNRVDTEYMMTLLKGAGYIFTADICDSDLIIINTCAFILPARKESIDTILEVAAKKRTGAKLVVAGCLSEKYEEELKEGLHEVDRFLGINECGEIVSIVDELLSDSVGGNEKSKDIDNTRVFSPLIKRLPITGREIRNAKSAGKEVVVSGMPVSVKMELSALNIGIDEEGRKPVAVEEAFVEGGRLREGRADRESREIFLKGTVKKSDNYRHSDRVLTTPRHYAYLRIADGCDNRCTYCTIPSIRGKYRSREISDIVGEARALAEKGVKEAVIVAQDVTYYGKDLYGEISLTELLRELGKLDGIMYRLLYCYPERINAKLIDEIKNNDKVIKYIDIPLQHCNSRLLKLMGRKSSKENIELLIRDLRAAIPEIALRTTFILGFPGETREEFEELLEFLRVQEFTNVGFFAYSPEEDTPSFRLRGHVSSEEADRRVYVAASLQKEVVLRNNTSLIGTVQKVIIDSAKRLPMRKFSTATALEPNILRYGGVGRAYCHAPGADGTVIVKAPRPLVCGEVYEVKIIKVKGYDIIGVTV